MRMSRAITVTLLSGLMLTACCATTSGCGRRPAAPDHTWYDAGGNRIEERWKTDEHGTRVLDANGRPIPDPHVPHDRYGRPWVYAAGGWAPLLAPAGSRSSRSSSWLFGGSGYRSTGGSSYHPGGSGSSSSSSSSSISRGGFGGTGSSSSS